MRCLALLLAAPWGAAADPCCTAPFVCGGCAASNETCHSDKVGCLACNCACCNPAPPPPAPPGVNATRVLVAGDSWGEEGWKPLQKVLQAHKPYTTVSSIAVGGSTAAQWKGAGYLQNLQNAAKNADFIWFSAGGNDAISDLPGCLKGPAGCGDKLMAQLIPDMQVIMEAIGAANPKVQVIGFGYDVMGMSKLPACPAMADLLFPGCVGGSGNLTRIECWNTQFERLQLEMWAGLAAKYPFVNTVNLLGTLQAASGDKAASPGHPDMAQFGPNSLMQINCIHANDKGWPIVFEEMYSLFWSKVL